MYRSFKKDNKEGKQIEKKVLKELKKYSKNVKWIEDKFSKIDMIDYENKYLIEIKSRNVYKGTYKDYMIGMDKCLFCKDKINNQNKFKLYKFMFINYFNDGPYYAIIDTNDLNNKKYSNKQFKGNLFQRSKREDKTDVEKPYLFVPDSDFKPLSEFKNRHFKMKMIKK